jgi:hypothetical protein
MAETCEPKVALIETTVVCATGVLFARKAALKRPRQNRNGGSTARVVLR